MATVVKSICSDCGRYRADIEQSEDGAFQIKVLKWTEEWVEGYGKVAEFWERATTATTFTDTLHNAEKLATEALANDF